MQKSKSFCLFIPLLFPILIISCSKHTHYDGATFREYENFDSQGLTVIITPDAQNIDIEYNFDSSLVKEFEVLFRHNINEHLSPFLAKYSTLDHVSWGAIKPRQSLATWEFEIQELKLHFNLPTDNSKIELLVAGTDGSDGPANAAGGFADGNLFNSREGGQSALDQANAGAFLEQCGNLFVTGPTGTNVMDLLMAIKNS